VVDLKELLDLAFYTKDDLVRCLYGQCLGFRLAILTLQCQGVGSPLSSELKGSLGTSLGIARCEAAALHLFNAMAEISAVVLEVLSALCDLLGVVMARVGCDSSGSQDTSKERSEMHLGVGASDWICLG
jgi:hypothetical protein